MMQGASGIDPAVSTRTLVLPICGYGIVGSMTPQWSTMADCRPTAEAVVAMSAWHVPRVITYVQVLTLHGESLLETYVHYQRR